MVKLTRWSSRGSGTFDPVSDLRVRPFAANATAYCAFLRQQTPFKRPMGLECRGINPSDDRFSDALSGSAVDGFHSTFNDSWLP
jgi:hypothetical protein